MNRLSGISGTARRLCKYGVLYRGLHGSLLSWFLKFKFTLGLDHLAYLIVAVIMIIDRDVKVEKAIIISL